MPWAVIIIIIFVCCAVNVMVPGIVTGTSGVDTALRNITPLATILIAVAVVAIAIFNRRH